MVKLVPHDVRFFVTTSALRDWFDANHWVTTGKQAATRERRLVALIEDSKAGRAVKPLTPPRTGT